MTTFEYNITPKLEGPEVKNNIYITSEEDLDEEKASEFGEYMRQSLKEYFDANVELFTVYLNHNEK
jgi:hypothetical protein